MDSKAFVRQAFDRAARGYADAAVLQREVARRLDERLACMRIEPARVLDAGCGTGFALSSLRTRFPRAALVALDLSTAMLGEARAAASGSWMNRMGTRIGLARSPFSPVCADIEHIPLATASVDLAWSNLALQWVDVSRALAEFRRVLRPGGLVLFSTFGPDTLRELRAAFAAVDGQPHVNRFIDMHDIGDALMHAGFVHPVMEMEYLTLTYTDLAGLLREIKAMGAHTVLDGRRAGLFGKAAWQGLQAAYEPHRRADGRLPATWEVVYGHAWVGESAPTRRAQPAPEQTQPIRWHSRGAGSER